MQKYTITHGRTTQKTTKNPQLMILQGLSPHWKLSHSVVWLPVRVFVCSSVRECLKDGGAQMLMPGDEVWRREGLMSLWSLFSALKISEVGRPYLHLCKLDRVFVALPVEPVDPLWKKQQQPPPKQYKSSAFPKLHIQQWAGSKFHWEKSDFLIR